MLLFNPFWVLVVEEGIPDTITLSDLFPANPFSFFLKKLAFNYIIYKYVLLVKT